MLIFDEQQRAQQFFMWLRYCTSLLYSCQRYCCRCHEKSSSQNCPWFPSVFYASDDPLRISSIM